MQGCVKPLGTKDNQKDRGKRGEEKKWSEWGGGGGREGIQEAEQ